MNQAMKLLLATAAVSAASGAALTGLTNAAATTTTVHTIGGATYQGGWAGVWAEGSGGYTRARGEVDAVGHFRAAVTCLNVRGHDGVVTARITSSSDANYPVGEYIDAEAIDNGGTSDMWRISFNNNGGLRYVAPACYATVYSPVAIQAGHVNVH